MQALAGDRCSFAKGSCPTQLIEPSGAGWGVGYQRLVEAPAVVVRDSRYYIMYSGDNCCRTDPHYAVMVARSESATGPFQVRTAPDSTDNLLLDSGVRWIAPGHNTLIRDDAGVDWILYHAIDSQHAPPPGDGTDDDVRRPLLLDRLSWEKGRPVCTAPSNEPQPVPTITRRPR